MKTKQEIVTNWLPRYTGVPLENIGSYVLLVNFSSYVKLFAEWHNVPIDGKDHNMISATANDITIINFGMGSANAATIMDLLMAVKPKACLFLGKCGGLKVKNELGDLVGQIVQGTVQVACQTNCSTNVSCKSPKALCRLGKLQH